MRSVFTRPGVYGSGSFRVKKNRRFPSEIFFSQLLTGEAVGGKLRKGMDESDFKFQTEVRERLAKIETMLQQMNYCDLEKAANRALSMSENNANEINKLQSAQTWLIRTVIGAIVAAVMGFILVK